MKPVLITRQSLANRTAESWRRQYQDAVSELWAMSEALITHSCLVELGPTPKPDDIDAVIGRCWTALTCDACGKRGCGPWVQIGDLPSYGSRTCTLCVPCLAEAVAEVPR